VSQLQLAQSNHWMRAFIFNLLSIILIFFVLTYMKG